MGKAIILQGLDFSKISIGKVHISGGDPLRSLTGINGPSDVVGTANAAIYYPSYSPLNTAQREVSWSIVSGSEYATITNGVLSIIEGAYKDTVIIRASSTVDSTITIDKSVTVTYSTDTHGYITSGLVAHWDAIDKNNDNNPSKWGDIVGDSVAGSQLSVFGSDNTNNYAEFDGAHRMYFITDGNIPVTTTKYTIEICYDKSNAAKKECLFVYSTQENDALAAFATWGDNGEYIITGNRANQKCFKNIGTYPRTTSVVNQTKCIINGVSQEVSESQNYLGGLNKYIGGGYSTYFDGKIYSIRIYNRELSDEEIINNQKYDKLRFGL